MNFLSGEIFGLNERFFGLDLSDLSLKALQFEKIGRRTAIRGYAYGNIPAGHMSDGNIVKKEEVARIIKESLGRSAPKRISTKNVVCSLPESKVFLRKISIPKMEEKERQEAVRWEIEANIPLSVDQVYYDWQEVEESKDKINILTVAIAKEYVDNLVETLEIAGLNAYSLEVESIATARSLIPKGAKSDEIYFVADLGAKRTSFIITEGNIPYFTSSIPFSSEGMNDIISKEMGVGLAEAEKIKMTRGIGHASEPDSLFPALEPYLKNLSCEIDKSLDFYQSITKTKKLIDVKKVILCGGGSNLKGIVPYMAKALQRDISIGDPWTNIDFGGKLPSISRETSSEFVTAIGLAIRNEE